MATIEARDVDPDGKTIGFWRAFGHLFEELFCCDPFDLWALQRAEYDLIRPYMNVDRVVGRAALIRAYESAANHLVVRERLTRQLTETIKADSEWESASLARDYLSGLSAEEQALLWLRLLAYANVAHGPADVFRDLTAHSATTDNTAGRDSATQQQPRRRARREQNRNRKAKE